MHERARGDGSTKAARGVRSARPVRDASLRPMSQDARAAAGAPVPRAALRRSGLGGEARVTDTPPSSGEPQPAADGALSADTDAGVNGEVARASAGDHVQSGDGPGAKNADQPLAQDASARPADGDGTADKLPSKGDGVSEESPAEPANAASGAKPLGDGGPPDKNPPLEQPNDDDGSIERGEYEDRGERQERGATDLRQGRVIPWSELYASLPENPTDEQLAAETRRAIENAAIVHGSYTGEERNKDMQASGDLDIVTGNEEEEVTMLVSPDMVLVRSSSDLERAIRIGVPILAEENIRRRGDPPHTEAEYHRMQERIEKHVQETVGHEQEHVNGIGDDADESNYIFGIFYLMDERDGELGFQEFHTAGIHQTKLQQAITLVFPESPSKGDLATIKNRMGYQDAKDVAERAITYNLTHEDQYPVPPVYASDELLYESVRKRVPSVELNHPIDQALRDLSLTETFARLAEISPDAMQTLESLRKERRKLVGDLAYLQVYPQEPVLLSTKTVDSLTGELAYNERQSLDRLLYRFLAEDPEAAQLWTQVIVAVGRAAKEEERRAIADNLHFIRDYRAQEVDGLLAAFDQAGVAMREYMPDATAGERIAVTDTAIADEPAGEEEPSRTWEQVVSFMQPQKDRPQSDLVVHKFNSIVDGEMGNHINAIWQRDFRLGPVAFQEEVLIKRVLLNNPGELIDISITRQLDTGRPVITVTHVPDNNKYREPGDPPREKEHYVYMIAQEGKYKGKLIRRDQDLQEMDRLDKEKGVYVWPDTPDAEADGILFKYANSIAEERKEGESEAQKGSNNCPVDMGELDGLLDNIIEKATVIPQKH